jgi:hypothetical protein
MDLESTGAGRAALLEPNKSSTLEPHSVEAALMMLVIVKHPRRSRLPRLCFTISCLS